MSNVLFELPLHPIGEKRVAILSMSDTLYQTVNLDALGLDFLPEVLILDDCRYRYAGIEYGRGVYRKEDEIPPTKSPFPQDAKSWTDAFDSYNDYLDDISESLAQAIRETSARELVDVTQRSSEESIADALKSTSDGLDAFEDNYLDDESLIQAIGEWAKTTTPVKIVPDDQFLQPSEDWTNKKRDPVEDIQYFLSRNEEIRTRKHECDSEKGCGEPVQSPSDPASGPALMHNDLHNPACMQCERCRILAEKLAEMLENPPGFEGIKVDEEFYGNKYIDYGWQEAVRVVQSLIVPCGNGTIEETASSLVENEELP